MEYVKLLDFGIAAMQKAMALKSYQDTDYDKIKIKTLQDDIAILERDASSICRPSTIRHHQLLSSGLDARIYDSRQKAHQETAKAATIQTILAGSGLGRNLGTAA